MWDGALLRGPSVGRLTSPLFRFRYADLFSGCGGMSLGLEQAAEAVGGIAASALAIDNHSKILSIYGHNIQCEHLINGDITAQALPSNAMLGDIDILIGGPPCQGHSNLNNHTRRDDDRNRLYFELVRFALDYEVPVVAIENVPAVRWSRRGVVEQATAAFRLAGYEVQTAYVNALNLGVPQTRKRHFLLASRRKMPDVIDLTKTFQVEPRTVGWAIGDLIDQLPEHPVDVPANLSQTNRLRIEEMFRNDWYNLPDYLRPPCHQNGHNYGSVYGRLRWDEPSGTITTGFSTPGRGRFIHPLRPRTLTMHEAARLQTFPDTFEFFPPGTNTTAEAVKTAIGNAVPPKLAFVIGLWAIAALDLPREESPVELASNGAVRVEPERVLLPA